MSADGDRTWSPVSPKALLWVVGPLLLMPATLGMPMFTVNTMALPSLIGHLIFGLALAAVVVALSHRTRH